MRLKTRIEMYITEVLVRKFKATVLLLESDTPKKRKEMEAKVLVGCSIAVRQ